MMSAHHVLKLLEDRNASLKEDERDRVTYASALGFASYADETDLEDLENVCVNSLWRGEVSEGELLYTPAGMVVGEQITSEEDHFGVKLCLVFVGDGGDDQGVATLRKLQMEAHDSNKKNPFLDFLLQQVDNKVAQLKAGQACWLACLLIWYKPKSKVSWSLASQTQQFQLQLASLTLDNMALFHFVSGIADAAEKPNEEHKEEEISEAAAAAEKQEEEKVDKEEEKVDKEEEKEKTE